jgi:alkaline phosphatase D
VAIDGATAIMTVTLKDVEGRNLWSIELAPDEEKRPSGHVLIRS